MIRRLSAVIVKQGQAVQPNRAPSSVAAAKSTRQTLSNRFEQRFALSSSSGKTREEVIASILESKVEASKAVVHDISGGCGSMYKIEVESPLFVGKGLVAQHRMVKDALKTEIADMHGLTLLTRPPAM